MAPISSLAFGLVGSRPASSAKRRLFKLREWRQCAKAQRSLERPHASIDRLATGGGKLRKASATLSESDGVLPKRVDN
jgi:hypothetical protein